MWETWNGAGLILRLVCTASFLLLLGFAAWAQLPPTQKLSVEDERGFKRELERLEGLLPRANNKPAIELQIAKTYAAGGQYPEAMRRLSKVVETNLGFDPSRDPDFRKLRDTAEFQSIMDEVDRQTPPVHNSRLMATLDYRDLRPENITFDFKRNAFVLGNTEVTTLDLLLVCLVLVHPPAAHVLLVCRITEQGVTAEIADR